MRGRRGISPEVVESIAGELELRGRLYYWPCAAEQEEVAARAVPCAKLLASHHDRAVLAVAKKNTEENVSRRGIRTFMENRRLHPKIFYKYNLIHKSKNAPTLEIRDSATSHRE